MWCQSQTVEYELTDFGHVLTRDQSIILISRVRFYFPYTPVEKLKVQEVWSLKAPNPEDLDQMGVQGAGADLERPRQTLNDLSRSWTPSTDLERPQSTLNALYRPLNDLSRPWMPSTDLERPQSTLNALYRPWTTSVDLERSLQTLNNLVNMIITIV